MQSVNKELTYRIKNLQSEEMSECAFADDVVIMTEGNKTYSNLRRAERNFIEKHNENKQDKNESKDNRIGKAWIKLGGDSMQQVHDFDTGI